MSTPLKITVELTQPGARDQAQQAWLDEVSAILTKEANRSQIEIMRLVSEVGATAMKPRFIGRRTTPRNGQWKSFGDTSKP